MSGTIVDKVFIGLDNAPAAFDIKNRILGPNGTNLEYIRSETGVVAMLKGDKFEPLHLLLHHLRADAITAAKSLALNLIETVKAELVQWSTAQAGGPPPALNVPPPNLTTAPPPVATPTSVTISTPSSMANTPQPAVIPPVVSAPASAPLMTVRQPTVLQFLQPQQQQYVLNQESGQLIPIVQPGMQMSNAISSLPLSQQLGALQQPNLTQFVDISGMPVNVTQLRLSGVPSSMSMILPNNFSFPQSGINTSDSTTVSTATCTPVVCAAQSTNSSQKIFYSTDKAGEKTELKYHIQGTDGVQWAMPGSQTMLIPYQQLQELSNQTGLANLQPQQYVSIAPAGGLQQTSLPLSAAQLQQLQTTGTIMHLNQKPITCSGSLINIISTGQASSPQIISNATPTKNINNQDQRGQKRLADGTPSQLQLRPIAPAGSHVQDKSSSRDARGWSAATARENTVVSMGMKINPAHGTIIHVSSGQQTSVSTSGMTQDGSGMYIRQIDRNAIQIQSTKDGKQELTTNKIQSAAQNVQMINLPPGMTVLQNPLNLGQMPVLGQHNNQVYMIPANQSNLIQGGLQSNILGQQMLQAGQNVTVMQNQLGMPNNVQYNVPMMMNMQPNAQYVSGINLNAQLSAQQLNAALGQQLGNPNLVSGTIPIVQAPPAGSPMPNAGQTISVTQPQQVQQILSQNSFITPTSQYMHHQYVMQPNTNLAMSSQAGITVPTAQNPNTMVQNSAMTVQNNGTIQYGIQSNPSSNSNSTNGASNPPAETETAANTNATNQNNYITSSETGYNMAANQQQQQGSFTDGANQQNGGAYTPQNTTYTAPSTNQNQGYAQTQVTTQAQATYANQTAVNTPNQNYPTNVQTVTQANFSPSAQNQTYANVQTMQNVTFPQNPQNPQNPYPNATGQNMAAYANNQYQYTNMQAQSRPWFRPKWYCSPQSSPYGAGGGPSPPAPQPVPPPPPGNYNYWQDS